MKQWKQDAFRNFANRQSELSDEHEIEQLSQWHFRIDGYIDVWPSGKKYSFTKYPWRVFRYGRIEDIFNHKKNRMAKWKSQSTGLLTVEDVKEGDIIKFLEIPYTTEKGFTNVKVELPNGDHKLGSVNDFSGKYLSEAWGEEMEAWAGRSAKVGIRLGKMSGREYYVLYPTDVVDSTLVSKHLTEDEKAAIQAIKDRENAGKASAEESDAANIPF